MNSYGFFYRFYLEDSTARMKDSGVALSISVRNI